MRVPGGETQTTLRASTIRRFMSLLTLVASTMGTACYGSRATLPSPPTVVVAYPAIPRLPASPTFSVSVNGTSVPVTLYNGKSIAWFAFSGTADVRVTVAQAVLSYVLSPLRNPVLSTRSGHEIRFTLAGPRKLVLRQVSNLAEELFIFADAPERIHPTPGEAGVFNMADYGTGASALQAAIDAASSARGVAYVAPGVHEISASVYLKSNANLYLAPGAVLAVPKNTSCCFDSRVVIPVVNATGARISGRGVLDGNGTDQSLFFNLVHTHNVDDFWVEDIMILDGYTTPLRVVGARNSGVKNIKVIANAPRLSDGIDIEDLSNFTIDDCFVFSTDDNVALGSGTDSFNYGVASPTDGVTIKNSVFHHRPSTEWTGPIGHLLSIVPHVSPAYIRNVLVENVDGVVTGTAFGFFASNGLVAISGVTIRNVRVEKSEYANFGGFSIDFTAWGGTANGMVDPRSGSIRDVTFDHVAFDDFGPFRNVFVGRSATQNIDNFRLLNLHIANRLILDEASAHVDLGPYVTHFAFGPP